MPNRRHHSRKFIGLWGTKKLHDELTKVAKAKKLTVSMLMWNILTDFTSRNGTVKDGSPPLIRLTTRPR